MDTLPPADAFAPAAEDSYLANNSSGRPGTASVGADGSLKLKVDEPQIHSEAESLYSSFSSPGRTRFNRLYLIGTTSTVLSVDALKAAIVEAKNGKDIKNYERAVRALAEVAPKEPEASLDTVWAQNLQRNISAQTERLEHELRGYKNNLIKESIRMGNEDLGNHYYETGDMVAASKAYSRMRDVCTTPNHITSMIFKMINVFIERNDWLGVASYAGRLRTTQAKPEEMARNQPKMASALGLSQMHSNQFFEAAKTFLSVDPSLADTYNEVLTPNDVAVYGGLCALASMNRSELQRLVLDNSTFRNFLELEPHIRRAIAFFCNSKFRPCLEILEAYRADYLLDLHLQRHVATLYGRIRTKAIQQFLLPFSSVTLDSMAAIFAPEVVGGQARPTGTMSPFVHELIGLIKDDVLDARIDLEKGLLVSNQSDLRNEVQAEALESVRSFNDELHLRTLRASVLHAGLQLSPPDPERKTGRGRIAASAGKGPRGQGLAGY
ncbi:COP9 signalosome subunit 1 (CsnA) [Penicillium chermesinum]|uniref:COP9 signalosome complex subunit 1 n=1 Tax=Penicillium chermesinum TaxID=63820 RepID=A0A9W9TN49_9EURO|nr:COP9 signalosome subunit 1 (CsnA) [Penicillium chermesinum]KAJ5232641.1 COP9 signalosome subunit 1 (CsnA) [Penicillium chermesinum]KAJ6172301.1 COP9 signalosome subunit 1 (CsnA) [Penicillium chermesinum]